MLASLPQQGTQGEPDFSSPFPTDKAEQAAYSEYMG